MGQDISNDFHRIDLLIYCLILKTSQPPVVVQQCVCGNEVLHDHNSIDRKSKMLKICSETQHIVVSESVN